MKNLQTSFYFIQIRTRQTLNIPFNAKFFWKSIESCSACVYSKHSNTQPFAKEKGKSERTSQITSKTAFTPQAERLVLVSGQIPEKCPE